MSRNELFFYKLGESLVRFRFLIIAAILIMGAFASLGLKDLRTSVSISNLFLENDKVIVDQKEFDSIFGNSDFVGVLVESEDVFSPETMNLIESLSRDLTKEVEFIDSVSSIFSFADGLDTQSLEDLRDSLDMRESVRGVLYSTNYKQAWILCSLKTYPSKEEWTEDDDPSFIVGKEVMAIIDRYSADGASLLATGIPVLEYRKTIEMLHDLIIVIGLAALIALLLIVFIIRSFQGVLGAVLVIGISISSVFGVMGWRQMIVDTTFMLIPILLSIAVSIGYTIHVFNFFKRNLILTGRRKESVAYAIKESGWPIMFTAFTTISALLSFLLVPISAIQWVGLVSAISISVVFLMAVVLFPAFIALGQDRPDLPEKTKEISDTNRGIDRIEILIGRFSDFVMTHGIHLSVIFILVLLISLYGATKLRVDLNTRNMMGDKMQHAIDQNYISDSEIGFTNAYNIALEFPENMALTEETLKKVDELTGFISRYGFIKQVSSINSIIKEVNRLRHRNDGAFYSIPEKDSQIRGLVMFARRSMSETMNSWIDSDNKTLRILVQIYDVSTLETSAHLKDLEKEIARLFPEESYPGFQYLLTGGVIQLSIMNQYITKGLVQSVFSALVVISIMMMIVFRNVKLGIIAMIPNITPVIITGGLMGFMGEPLEFVTMTIAPMVMGLAVDDTIHFINHVKTDFGRTGNYDKSIRNSFIRVGKALILANIILCATFAAFLTSAVHSMVNMGIYMIVAMVSALIADFTVTPYIIKLSRPFKGQLETI
ncbi:efflux RND transporter permease subunit [Spirochaeta isovalerica]|uniref:SSD domain-containing protein n=1 Tax=Spirochaeta isovalerica TaxID=150 RepID=A0A841R9N6_9SPIO|nr:MMPL family transporter [Spirochaeta isovalerica]MBB6479720.1 hypothetical protein [Spirochaeta isovalerica]